MSAVFTKEMKKDYTILVPNMSPLHFALMEKIFIHHGYRIRLLDNYGSEIIQIGLRYVHNDMCYPCLLVIGQLIDAIEKGLVDRNRCALAISQTGGGCRASNYYNLLIKALSRAGMEDIPVISLNLAGMNSNPGFKITPMMLIQAYTALVYGDLIMLLSNQTRPYEINPGDTDKTVEKWISLLSERYMVNRGYFWKNIKRNLNAISDDFASIAVKRVPKVKVGIVGEIYMKYSKLGNSDLEGFLRREGVEVMLPPLSGFLIYGLYNKKKDAEYYGKYKVLAFLMMKLVIPVLKIAEKWSDEAVKRHPEYVSSAGIDELVSLGERFIDIGCKMGEGWLLTAEMAELIEKGYSNIVCTQPFGCLPNHIVGKGMIRSLKEAYPDSNIVPIDYDPSASKVNQENRIKLMLSVARDLL